MATLRYARRFSLLFASLALGGAALVAACVGDEPAGPGAGGGADSGSDAVTDGAGGDGSTADSCASATTCGADTCVDLKTDPAHCGTCDVSCKNSAGTPFACVQSVCGNKVAQLSAGRRASCVLLLDGSVWCWGQQVDGETGQVSALLTPVPQKVAGLPTIVAVHSASSNSCAIDTNGDVWCWGDNRAGQLAQTIGTEPECGGNCNHTPQKVTLPEKTAQITGSNETMCVRTVPGNVYCWGRNEANILGQGTDPMATHATPLKIPVFAGDVTDLDLTYANNGFPGLHALACAVRADKTVWCWGSNVRGELGHVPDGGTSADITCAGTSPYACNATPQPIPGASGNLANVVKVKTRNMGACALLTDQTVWCWGNNNEGELGQGVDDGSIHTLPLEALDFPVATLTSADVSSFALTIDGGVYVWGANPNGVLGLGNFNADLSGDIARNGSLGGIVQLSTYADHGLALKADGTMVTWGNNTTGVLGHAPNSGTDVVCPATGNGACNATPAAFGTAPWQ